jgi:2-polyprenyl-3-methyl-5-hydroxy-6-metoxy-1,4-benzoquinol methylase
LADTKVKTDHELHIQGGDSVRWQTVILLWGLVGICSAIVSVAQESTPKSSLQDRWDAAYRDGRRAPWDISRPATDLKQQVENGTLRPCRVVELGCGPGNDAVYLASRGFDVTAIGIEDHFVRHGQRHRRL